MNKQNKRKINKQKTCNEPKPAEFYPTVFWI